MATREVLQRFVVIAIGVLSGASMLIGLIRTATWGGPNGSGGNIPVELLAMFVVIAVATGLASSSIARHLFPPGRKRDASR